MHYCPECGQPMTLESTPRTGSFWFCPHDGFIRPYGSTVERIKRLPIKKAILMFSSIVILLTTTSLLIYVEAKYPDGPKIFTGFETNCGEQFDRYSCAEVPTYVEDRTGLDNPQWEELLDGYGWDGPIFFIVAIASTFVFITQGTALWELWTTMGGIGPLGRRNHKHRCPKCMNVWHDDEPGCPGVVSYECAECWGTERNRNRRRIGDSGCTRLVRYDSSYGTLARHYFLGFKYNWWIIVVSVIGVILLLGCGRYIWG